MRRKLDLFGKCYNIPENMIEINRFIQIENESSTYTKIEMCLGQGCV